MLLGLIGVILVIVVAVFVLNKKSPTTSITATATPSASTSSSATASPETSNLTVTYDGSSFTPAILTIQKGQTVTFMNSSDESMWVASDPHPTHINYPQFDAKKDYKPGESYTFTFDRVGSWGYHNHEHSGVKGTIIVK
jgi:plastocyanin